MKRKKSKNSDDAVVGIVTTFLIIGLMVAVVSVIQTTYIPKWMEQTESEHMEAVADQFAQLKFATDTQSAIQQKNIPITTSITLGNKELPFLMSIRAFGSLDILSNVSMIKITKKDASSFSYSLGTIKYSSSNAYFIDQTYIYEAGAVILSQSQGNSMSIKPSFSVIKERNVSMNFTVINISTIGEKRSIAGYGTYPIQAEFSNSADYVINNVSNITIGSNYQNAWHTFINRTLNNSGLNYNTNFSIYINGDRLTVEFDESITVNFYLKVVEINAQIAPGWIENTKG